MADEKHKHCEGCEAHRAAEREGLLALALGGGRLPGAGDREVILDHLDVELRPGDARQFGAHVGVVLVLVEIDREAVLREADAGEVAEGGLEEAVHLAAGRVRREEEEELADVLGRSGKDLPLRVAFVEGPEDALEHRRRRDRAADGAGLVGLLHVARELVELVQRLRVLQRLRLLALGDDDELRGADEVLVHLPERDVVRVVGIEERRPGGRVARLHQAREVEPEGEHEHERDRHADPAVAGREPDEEALEDRKSTRLNSSHRT